MAPELLAGLAISVTVAYWATPVVIRVADRFDFYDRPVGYKGHARPTPYLGGTAVMAGFLLTVAGLTGDWDRTLPLVGGVIALWALGTVDDRRTVTPTLRVLAEAGLATLLWATGLGWSLGLGELADWLASVVWVIAVVNAFNLFDNMDGAAGSMAAVVSAALAILGLIEDDVWLAVVATALCGACVGFLPHNLASPSRIFLGDGGSMPIGFTVAALAMIGAADAAPEWQSLAMGVLLVGVPALDTALVIVSRTRRGVPIVTAGQDHITHRARRWLPTARAVALTLGAAQAMVSSLALVALRGSSALTVVLVVLYLVSAGVVISLLEAPDRETAARTANGRARGAPGRPAWAAAAFLAALGLLAGLSPFFSGYYDSEVWVPAGLGLVVLVAGMAIARPMRLTGPAVAALAALAAMGLLALASALWTDSIEQAVFEGDRLLGYTMLLGALLLAMRQRRHAVWVLGAIGVGALVVAGDVLVRMLGDRPAALFIEGRLNEPLGYINGQASFFLIALWTCIAVAEQRRRPLLAGAGLGAATLVGCLLVLSQSRGVAAAAVASALLVLALMPGRLRRAWALLVALAGVVAAAPVLVDVYGSRAGTVDAATAHAAARATLIAAVGAGVVWGLVAAAVAGAPGRAPGLRRLAAAALAAVSLAVAVVTIANQASVRRTVDEQFTAFVHQRDAGGTIGTSTSRLASGAGNRYDYWRIAWDAWRDHPVGGIGAGGYDKPYFAHRTTTENVRQPHSVVLQTLSDLGVVGALLLALFVGAVAAGAWRVARVARESAAARFAGVAASGAFTAWLVHASVDWMHLLPGLTAMALAGAAALLVAPAEGGTRPARVPAGRPLGRRLVPAVVVGLVLVVASLSLTRQGLTEHFRAEAQEALAARPADALVQADRALRLDHEAVGAYYVKAAALARFGRGPAARAVLLEAARREPENFVTWTLMGDLAVRMGDLDEAREHYGRALRLNPRDPQLRQLVVDPEAATARPVGG